MRLMLAIVFTTLFTVPQAQALAKEPEINAKKLFAMIRELEKAQHATNPKIAAITGRTPFWQHPGVCMSEKSANSLITEVHTTRSRNGQTMGVLLFLNHDLRILPEEVRQSFGQKPLIRKQPRVGIHGVYVEFVYERKLGWTRFWFERSQNRNLVRYADIVYRHDAKS